MIAPPSATELAAYSKLVYENCPYNKEKEKLAERRSRKPSAHEGRRCFTDKICVLYVIKENRTYDQVLGDVKEGTATLRFVFFRRR